MDRRQDPTPASTWLAASGRPIADDLLEWPPDLFALTEVILERSQAYRFLLSKPGGLEWPPRRVPHWSRVVEEESRQWSAWIVHQDGGLPALLADEWRVLRERAAMPLEDLAEGRDRRMCEALLAIHAIADEACAGVGVALGPSDGRSCVYHGRGRELLARTGSLARVHPQLLRVLPKVRTSPNGTSLGSFSRYACVHRPGATTRWHKIPARHRGTGPGADHANLLLLPWPLRVRETDFRPVEDSVRGPPDAPSGCFEFAPAERLDLDLVGRTIEAALDEVGSVDVVCLPESAVDEGDIDELEALLEHQGVTMLITGVRQRAPGPGRLPGNWVHTGVSPRLEKGERVQMVKREQWFHVRQNKHHRWSLDETQVYQYHLGGALHPKVRWWELMDVPRRSLQFVELGEDITIIALVCEDLAQIDDVAEVIRAVGPTCVVTPLLDGPQLPSRWAARYASVLADDPGSAVCTLSSFGMVQRCRPSGREASRVFALWKDPARGAREIPLEAGAQGVILTTCGGPAPRTAADGRAPVNNAVSWFDVAVHQIRASPSSARPPAPRSEPTAARPLEVDELTVLTGWAQALAEALAYAPEHAQALLGDARAGTPWRAALGIAEPSPRLGLAIESMARAVQASTPSDGVAALGACLLAASESPVEEAPLDRLVRRVLRSALEQARARQVREARESS
jgi:hypothetical protein